MRVAIHRPLPPKPGLGWGTRSSGSARLGAMIWWIYYMSPTFARFSTRSCTSLSLRSILCSISTAYTISCHTLSRIRLFLLVLYIVVLRIFHPFAPRPLDLVCTDMDGYYILSPLYIVSIDPVYHSILYVLYLVPYSYTTTISSSTLPPRPFASIAVQYAPMPASVCPCV